MATRKRTRAATIASNNNTTTDELDAVVSLSSSSSSSSSAPPVPASVATSSAADLDVDSDVAAIEAMLTEPESAPLQAAADAIRSAADSSQSSSVDDMRPVIQNVVCTFSLGCRVDLKIVATRARNAEYNPKRFASCIMRLRDPKTTALVFESGKVVVTGAVSEALSKLAAKKYARIIQRIGFTQVSFINFTVQNVVAIADVSFPVKLEAFARDFDEATTYEPELFPALTYRMATPKCAIMVFVNGKVVITGAKQTSHVHTAFNKFYPVLIAYRKGAIKDNVIHHLT